MTVHPYNAGRRRAERRLGAIRYDRGMTLIELMIAIVILAVLLGIAVPSFREAALGSRLSATANNLLSSVQLARSEAIKRNVTIRLCASADGATCAAAGDWEQGWVILDPDDVVISSQQEAPTGLKILEADDTLTLSFQPIGIGATVATFTVCRSSPVGSQERVLRVTASGSAAVTRTQNGVCG